jgi:hypothetical protein
VVGAELFESRADAGVMPPTAMLAPRPYRMPRKLAS